MFDENYIMTSILGLLGIIAWSKHLFFLKYISYAPHDPTGRFSVRSSKEAVS